MTIENLNVENGIICCLVGPFQRVNKLNPAAYDPASSRHVIGGETCAGSTSEGGFSVYDGSSER
jgi:hypothetical protein